MNNFPKSYEPLHALWLSNNNCQVATQSQFSAMGKKTVTGLTMKKILFLFMALLISLTGFAQTRTLTLGSSFNPTTCGGSGVINLSVTNISAGLYTLRYTRGDLNVNAVVEVTSSSSIVLERFGITAGTYDNFGIYAGQNLIASASGSTTLQNPTSPTLVAGNVTNPTTCTGTDGKIAFTTTGLPNSDYDLRFAASAGATTTSPQRVTVSGNTFSLNNLTVGTYSAFSITRPTTQCTGSDATTKTVECIPACSQVATATQTMTWTGTANTDWNNPCNWSPNGVPTATNFVSIPNVANDPVIMSGTTANTFKVDIGDFGSLTINNGGELNVLTTNTSLGDRGLVLRANATFTNRGTLNVLTTANVYTIVEHDNTTFINSGTVNVSSPSYSIILGGSNIAFTNEASGLSIFKLVMVMVLTLTLALTESSIIKGR